MTPEAQSIIIAFLKPNPKDRLGSEGLEQIKNHPFFKSSIASPDDIDWDDLYNQEPPDVIKDKLLEVEIPTADEPQLEADDSVLQAIKACGKANEKIQKKLENFDQVRYDLLHQKNVDAYQQLLYS